MDSKKILLTGFIIVALVQLFVPGKMIWEREDVMDTGTDYKFKTAPIDPNDPFRGKYIVLSFDENPVSIANEKDWTVGESIYVSFTEDKTGFAKVELISKTKPVGNPDFIKAKVRFVTKNGSNELTIDYPFDRYYMEESKAHDTELTFRQSQQDTSKVAYALVSIKNGDAVLKDVLIDGTPIRDLVKTNQERNAVEKH